MDTATKTVQLNAGPIGYVYAMDKTAVDTEMLSMLSGRSADSALAVAPLIRNLTVESDFSANVAVVSGSRTTGLGGSGVTLKLTPTHYHPAVFVFHGGDCLKPSTAATGLTTACASAARKFGFSEYSKPLQDGVVETTAAAICEAVSKDPSSTILYLVVTDAFKEAVYLCNSYLHYGGTGTVAIGDDAAVAKIPIYPVQLFMPDLNRVVSDPFNSKFRSIGEGFAYPTPFFNDDLCRLLYGYVLGTAGVALRVRNLDAVARGAAHLAFDDCHEGAVLPNDLTFTLFESGGGSGQGGAQRGGRGTRNDGGAKPAAGGCNGLERRLASLMAADTAMAVESLTNAAVFEEYQVSDVSEWPIIVSNENRAERLEALGEYSARLACVVGSMVFSSNSALHMTEVEDAGTQEGKDGGAGPSFYRFFQFPAPYLAGNPQVDRDGRPVDGLGNQAPAVSCNGAGQEFSADHLAMMCGFSPQLLARILFYLERCDGGFIASRQETDTVKYVAGSIDSDAQCPLCDKTTRASCINTTLHRLRYRLPKFGTPFRGPIGVFGAMNSNYSDCDPLGNYAAYSSLRKADGEAARTVMQDTYRVAAERVLIELDKIKMLDRSNPVSLSCTDPVIRDKASFVSAVAEFKRVVERETDNLMRNLVEVRDYKIREGLNDANHTMTLSIDPYSTGLCPALSFMSRRTILTVIQDLALSQCHSVFCGQQVEAKNFRQQFQPVLRRKFMDMLNGGFVTSRTTTLTISDAGISAPDPTLPQTAPPSTDNDGDLTRVSLEVPRDLKIKNRVLFSAGFGGGSVSEAARARMAGLVESYQRPDKRQDILNGPLGFLLKRYHHVLFPDGKPPGCKEPNSQWFWTVLQRNQMSAKLLSKDDINFITFVKRFNDDYSAMNYISVPPSNAGELAQFLMTNLILKVCDHRNFFINTITAVTATAKRPRDKSSVVHWISRDDVREGSDVEKAADALLRDLGNRPYIWTASFDSTNIVRTAMNTKPLVVLGLSVSKYNGSAGSSRVFQAGNWSGLNGGKNVCPFLAFDRTRRFVMTCPRVGFVSRAVGFGGGPREGTLVEQVRAALADKSHLIPQAAVFSTVLKALGHRMQFLDYQDWYALTDDGHLSALLVDMNSEAAGAPGGWSVESCGDLIKLAETAERASGSASCLGETTFDFGSCLALSDGVDDTGGAASQDCAQANAPAGQKRQRQDDPLFDFGRQDKRPTLTLDML